MNKFDIASEISDILGLRRSDYCKSGRILLNAVLTSMTNTLKRGERIYIAGFGTLKPRKTKYHKILFIPSPSILQELNKPYSTKS